MSITVVVTFGVLEALVKYLKVSYLRGSGTERRLEKILK